MKDSTAEQRQKSEQQHHRLTSAEEATASKSDHSGLARTVKSETVEVGSIKMLVPVVPPPQAPEFYYIQKQKKLTRHTGLHEYDQHHKHLALRILQNMNDLVQYHLNSISEHSKLHLWYYLKCPSDMKLPSLEEEAWRQGAPILLNCRTHESHCLSVSC